MRKILYLLNDDIHDLSGIIFKVKQQTKFWQDLGVKPYFYSIKAGTLYDSSYAVLEKMTNNNTQINNKLSLIVNYYLSTKFLNKIEKKYNWDMVYTREILPSYYLSKFSKNKKLIMEINGSSKIENKKNLFVKIYQGIHFFLKTKVLAYVFVSEELKNERSTDKRALVLANGTACEKLLLKEVADKSFIFLLTNNHSWQGLDKLNEIASKLSEFQFYVIGYEGQDTKNISYLGKLNSDEIDKFIVEMQPIGISSLALHRKQMYEASTLKSRHYLKHSLPTIFPYKDTDIPIGNQLFLYLENSEAVSSDESCEKIREYANKMFNNFQVRKDIYNFVIENIDNSSKEKKRIAFFEKVIDD